jgi:thioesterase domain-containing protein
VNGKLDKKALPKPENLYRDSDFISPDDLCVTEIEFWIASVWAEVLSIDSMSICRKDSFFSLGGDSFSFVRVFNIFREVFSKITFIDLLTHVVLDQLACFLSSPLNCSSSVFPICHKLTSIAEPIFLVHPIAGLSFCYLPFSSFSDRNIFGLNDPFFGKPVKFDSIEELAAYYVNLICATQPVGPYYIGGWSFGGVIALEMAYQLNTKNLDVAVVVMLDSFAFDQKDQEIEILSPVVSPRFQPIFIDSLQQQHTYTRKLLRLYRYKNFGGKVILIKAVGDEDLYSDPFNGWKLILPQLIVQSVRGKHDHLFTINPDIAMRQMLNAFDPNFVSPKYFDLEVINLIQKNLLYAIEQKNVILVRLFLDQYLIPDFNETIYRGKSYLQFAIETQDDQIIEMFK